MENINKDNKCKFIKEKSIQTIIANLIFRFKGELNYRKVEFNDKNPQICTDDMCLLAYYVQKNIMTEKEATLIMRKLIDVPSLRNKGLYYIFLKFVNKNIAQKVVESIEFKISKEGDNCETYLIEFIEPENKGE